MKPIFKLIFLLITINSYGNDTIYLDRKPKVILKSWYPEFKKYPILKCGEYKILFTIIPEFAKTILKCNDINLKTNNDNVLIEETDKTNQYLFTVNETKDTFVKIDVWLDIENKVILIYNKSGWQDIRKLFLCNGNRILIETIKLKIINNK